LKAVPCGTQGVADEWCILLKNIIYQSGKTTNTNTNTNTTNNTNTNTNNGYGTFEYATPRGYRKYVLKT